MKSLAISNQPPEQSRQAIFALVLALLLPTAILSAAYWRMVVLPVRQSMETAGEPRGNFACQDANIVVVGSSRARSDIDPVQLTELLAPPTRQAFVAMVHGSNAPVWYAVMKNGILARGCRPELFVIYDIMDKILAGDVLPDERVRLLAPFLSDDEPVIDAKIFKRSKGRGQWQRSREYVVAGRQSALEHFAAWSTGMMFASPSTSSRSALGRRVLDKSFDGVFAAEKLDQQEQPARAVPVIEPVVEERDVLATKAEDTFIEDIVNLARAHGAKVVFARAPSPPSRLSAEHAAPDLIRDGIALMRRTGAGFVDMRDQPVRDTWYADVRHMNAVGRRHNTRNLAAQLRSIMTDGRGETQAAAPLQILDGKAEYSAEPPPLPEPQPFRPGRGNTGVFQVPDLRFVADDACEAKEVLACCSPLKVAEDGAPLPFPNRQPGEVESAGGGRSAHVGGSIVFSATDGSTPTRNGRRYALSLDPTRFCGSYWLYPGDRVRFPEISRQLQQSPGSFKRLEVWARTFSAHQGAFDMDVKLKVDGELRVDARMRADQMDPAPLGWNLDPPITSANKDIVLELSTPPEAGFVLLTLAELS